MAVARLSRVTVEAPQGELGAALARVIEFGTFNPARREGMVQDVKILLLASRAQAVYSKATDLLGKRRIEAHGEPKESETFTAHTVEELVGSLEDYTDTIEENLSLFIEESDRRGVVDVLLAVQEASRMVFEDLQRILVYPVRDGRVTFEGYVPDSSVRAFRELLGGYVKSVEAVKASGKESAYVPTLLVNPRLIGVFESLTLQRGLPRYGEVDPTPILAFVFPFFFGIMFGDVGHGIALLAFGLYLIYRTTYKVWGKLILVLASSATVFGLIRGSFFGIPFTSPLSSIVPLPAVFSAALTLSNIALLLEIAIVIGTFHLASGYAIAFINQERAGNYVSAFLNRLPTLVLYSFMLPFGFAVVGSRLDFGVLFTSAAPTPVFDDLLGLRIPISVTATVTAPVIAATLVFLVLGHPVGEYAVTHRLRPALKAFGAGLIDAVAKPFEFFVNTLSYVRLGVLLVTTTLLGSLVAGVISYGVIGVLTAAFLNVAVISLEGLIVYIQDMRLQLYEWMSQFFVGGGTPFVPMISGGVHFSVNWS